MFCSFFSPKTLFSKTHSVCHFLLFLFSSVFPFNIPCSCVPQSLFRQYSRCVSLALSLLHLSFLCFCFFPSNHFPAIPFSNPPCFHFLSFGSSILPVYMILFSGLVFPSLFFLLVFVWSSSDCCHLSFLAGVYIYIYCCVRKWGVFFHFMRSTMLPFTRSIMGCAESGP